MNPIPSKAKASAILDRIREEVPSLGLTWSSSGPPAWAGSLAMIDDGDLLGGFAVDAHMAAALRSGILVRADLFEEPHAICQEIPTATGSYWHAIVHRREPDFANSRYWFHRVGEHPVFAELYRELSSLVGRPASEWRGPAAERMLNAGRWDPFLFVDLCEACDGGRGPECLRELESLQELEIEGLLRWSFEGAIGKTHA